jgi:hypothetical protein
MGSCSNSNRRTGAAPSLRPAFLRLAGVGAEVKKVGGERDVWRVTATTDKLAAGREEVRKALAEIVETARNNGRVDAGKAERWLEKLEEGRVLREGWPKYLVRLKEGALMVRFGSTNPDSVEEEARRFREMGLKEGVHFSVKMPEGGRDGYVSILKRGLGFCRLALRPRLRRTAETCRGLHKLYTGEGEGGGRRCV